MAVPDVRQSPAAPARGWVALLLSIGGLAQAGELFSTRDENPLLRGFYLPLASDSRAADATTFAATFSIANTLNVESRRRESLLVDGESDTLRLSVDAAFAPRWRYRLTIPVIHDSGGFLDPAIDAWHRWFGFQRGYRPDYPRGLLEYSYAGSRSLHLRDSQTSIGDVSAEAGWYALDDAARTVSVWGGVEAPTGSVAGLTGDGAWDAAVWAHLAQRWTRWQAAGELGLVQPFGDELYGGAAHRTSAFARGAVTRELGQAWSVRAQLDGQTGRVKDSGLRFLGPSLQLTVGAVRRLSRRWTLEFGLAEDVAVNTAPDITFFLGIHDQPVHTSGHPQPDRR